MSRQTLANGKVGRNRVVDERRHVREQRRRRRSKEIVENPLAPNYRRGPRRIGGHRQDAAVPQQPAPLPLKLIRKRDLAEMAAVNVRNSVMLREALVHERVVGAKQVSEAAVFAQDALDEKFRLLSEGLPEVVVEVRETSQVGRRRFEIAEVKPLARKIRDQAARPLVCEHPANLRFELFRPAKITFHRRIEQRVIGKTAPKEKR